MSSKLRAAISSVYAFIFVICLSREPIVLLMLFVDQRCYGVHPLFKLAM
jgi:hypothetical protein